MYSYSLTYTHCSDIASQTTLMSKIGFSWKNADVLFLNSGNLPRLLLIWGTSLQLGLDCRLFSLHYEDWQDFKSHQPWIESRKFPQQYLRQLPPTLYLNIDRVQDMLKIPNPFMGSCHFFGIMSFNWARDCLPLSAMLWFRFCCLSLYKNI